MVKDWQAKGVYLPTRQLSGGVLIYCMALLAIFAMVLQVYLDRQVLAQRQLIMQHQFIEAQILFIKTKATGKESLRFNKGLVSKKDGRYEVILRDGGQTYYFDAAD